MGKKRIQAIGEGIENQNKKKRIGKKTFLMEKKILKPVKDKVD